MGTEFDIQKIREVFSKLAWQLNWYHSRGGLLPYDWHTYGHPHITELLDLLKIDWDGSIKSKDKRGSWRVMKENKLEESS